MFPTSLGGGLINTLAGYGNGLANTAVDATKSIQAAGAVGAQQAANGGAVNGSSTTTGSGYTTPSAAQINNTYDTSSNFYKGLLNTVAPQQQNDINNTNQYFGDQQTGLQNQRDAAFANLDQQSKVANDSYNRSLSQLGNQIRNTYQGQSNALGTQGAGDSSATDMLGYALGQQANLQRGYMNQDENNQQTQVALTRDADKNQFDNQSAQINDLKQQQYSAIAKQYAQLQQQINTQLAQNEQMRKYALMNAGQWAQGQAAQVDQSLATALGNVQNAYNPSNQPKVAPVQFGSYSAHNVVLPTTSSSAAVAAPINTTSPQAIYDPYKQQQTY